ncbi:unnamed protein product [Symbiodinium sp. CCMP2592]|nr:unnamed protein product [Symbiodinium sp. CCMP2592]
MCRPILKIILVGIAVATMIIAVVALLLTLEGRLSLPRRCRCKRCEVMCRIPDRTDARGVLNNPAGFDNWKLFCSLETLHGLAWTIGAPEDLSSQHARQKVQTEELHPGKQFWTVLCITWYVRLASQLKRRGTLQDLQAEAQRLQTEQRRQAAALKGSLKAPDPSANMRLEKQVEGVVSIVKGQEERFERLETDITSAYESQRHPRCPDIPHEFSLSLVTIFTTGTDCAVVLVPITTILED